jgi:hypothetical protein
MNTESDNSHSNRSAPKLSDTQLMLLSAAAQRDDLCLTPRPNLKGGAAHKVAEKLITLGASLATESRTRHRWSRVPAAM